MNGARALILYFLNFALIDWWKSCAPDRAKAKKKLNECGFSHVKVSSREHRWFVKEEHFASCYDELSQFFSSDDCKDWFEWVDVNWEVKMKEIEYYGQETCQDVEVQSRVSRSL